MSAYYYPRNEILLPRWESKADKRGLPWWGWAAAVLALLALVAAGVWYYTWPEVNAKRATVLLLTDQDGDGKPESQGSGVIIKSDGSKAYVLTSRHVVTNEEGVKAAKVVVIYRSGESDNQKLEASFTPAIGQGPMGTKESLRQDYAVLQLATTEKLAVIPLSEKTDFAEEEEVKALGFPRANETATNQYGPSVTVQKGNIRRVDRSGQKAAVRITHSASTAEGMSGGPLIQGGKLVGLNTAVLGGGHVTANENYALPAYLLKESVFQQYGQK